MHSGDIIQERYRLEQVLGQGSMGVTYKAFDLRAQRPVAVKLLHFSRVREWKALELFEREANILQQLAHPHIPAYVDYFSLETPTDVQFGIVQEYIHGQTLQELVENGWRGTEAEILDIFWQLVQILAYLHTLRPPVIHRDLNPKNILLSLLNEAYLVDFGAVQERIRTTFLGGSTIVGTYGYVPFEQFSGQTVPASDYYALGATLLYMLSHRHPADFPTDELKLRFHDTLRASPPIMRLLDGLLEPSAKQRIASPDQIRDILAAAAQTRPSAAPRSSRTPKPPWSKIEQTAPQADHLRFRLPKNIIGFIPGQTLLELTPAQVTFQDAYKIGKKIGHSWMVPTDTLRPADVTWRFEKEKPVVGLNYAGNTLIINATLAVAEAEWLIQEIQTYLAERYLTTLPPTLRRELAPTAAPPFLELTPCAKPAGTRIEKTTAGASQCVFRVPRRFLTPKNKLGALFQQNILDVLALLIGARVIELTPAWLHLSTEYVGKKLGNAQHVPLAAIKPSDINWYCKKVTTGSGATKQYLAVGLNYAGRTLDIGVKLTQAEAEWLVQELRHYVFQYAGVMET